MYFINTKIVKSIANEVYREAGIGTDNATDYYVIYDDNNGNTVAFSCYKNEDDSNEFKHYIIDFISDLTTGENHNYYHTATLNRRELADKLLEIIAIYKQEVIA